MTNDAPLSDLSDEQQIREALAKLGYYCASFWHIDDVLEVRPDLTEERCKEVLEQCERRFDAGIGITWDVLEYHAEDLFPEGAP